MKALSLWEPWGTFVSLKLKRYETRSWSTSYRGPLLICTAQKRLPLIQIIDLLYTAGVTMDDLLYGKAVALVDLVAVEPTSAEHFVINDLERKLGDYSRGRFVWAFKNIKRFSYPFSIKGKQGLFDVEVEERFFKFA